MGWIAKKIIRISQDREPVRIEQQDIDQDSANQQEDEQDACCPGYSRDRYAAGSCGEGETCQEAEHPERDPQCLVYHPSAEMPDIPTFRGMAKNAAKRGGIKMVLLNFRCPQGEFRRYRITQQFLTVRLGDEDFRSCVCAIGYFGLQAERRQSDAGENKKGFRDQAFHPQGVRYNCIA